MNKEILLITGLKFACDNYFPSHKKILSSKYEVKIIPIESILFEYSRVASPFLILIYIYKFSKFIKNNHIDIVLSAGPQIGFINTFSSFLSFHKSWHWFTGIFWSNKNLPLFSISYWVDFFILIFIDKIYADSHWQKNFLKKKLVFGKYLSPKIKVPEFSSITSINKSLFNLRAQKNYYHLRGDNNFKVGYLGRLAKDKGIEIIPLIADEINNKYNCQIDFLICGPSDKKIGFNKEKRNLKDIKEKISFESNFVEVREKYYSKISFFKEIDVLILPSKREGFGIVCIEAQAVGIPIVCSDIEPLRESTHQFYNSFQCKYIQDYVNAIMLLYKKEIYQNFHQNAMKNSEKYREKNFKRTLNHVYFGK